MGVMHATCGLVCFSFFALAFKILNPDWTDSTRPAAGTLFISCTRFVFLLKRLPLYLAKLGKTPPLPSLPPSPPKRMSSCQHYYLTHDTRTCFMLSVLHFCHRHPNSSPFRSLDHLHLSLYPREAHQLPSTSFGF